MNCSEDSNDFMVPNLIMAWYLSSSYYLTEQEERKSLQFELTTAHNFMKVIGKTMQILLHVMWSVLNPFIFCAKIQDFASKLQVPTQNWIFSQAISTEENIHTISVG